MVQGLCLLIQAPQAVAFSQVVASCPHMGVPLSKACPGLLQGSLQVLPSFLVLPLRSAMQLDNIGPSLGGPGRPLTGCEFWVHNEV